MNKARWQALKMRGTQAPSPPDHDQDCLVWPGATTGAKVPYGVAGIDGKTSLLHRAVWAYFHPDEELPPGRPPRGTPRIVVTHSCFRSLCYEPTHLVLKAQRENLLERPNINHWAHKQTHCLRGHDLKDAHITKDGRRDCVKCRAER